MNNSQGFPIWLPFFAIGLWLTVSATLSQLSRWPELARRFPANGIPDTARLGGQVASVGGIGERNVTSLIIDAQGLYLFSNPLFRFRRPPILVPWPDVKYVSQKRTLGTSTYLVELGGVTTLRVREKAFNAMAPFVTRSM